MGRKTELFNSSRISSLEELGPVQANRSQLMSSVQGTFVYIDYPAQEMAIPRCPVILKCF